MIIEGRAWVFGDDIDTDLLAPGYAMKLPPRELARHCLTAVDPRFAEAVAPGDVVVAGANFGLGSSREQAAISLKELGVGAVLARSFARIFYRNAMNIGLPALFCPDTDQIRAGDRVRVDALAGEVVIVETGARLAVRPIPPHLLAMLEAGGLMAQLRSRLAQEAR